MRAYLGRPERVPFDFPGLISSLAPRPVFVSAPVRDSNFQWRSVARIAALAREVFRLYQAESRLQVRHPECGHRFPPEVRQEAYGFMEQTLAMGPRAG